MPYSLKINSNTRVSHLSFPSYRRCSVRALLVCRTNMIAIALSLFLLALSIRAQQAPYQCSCGCCNSPGCNPGFIGYAQSPTCSSEACLAQCRCTFPQCLTSPPYGQVVATCSSPVPVPVICNCQCCNTGSVSCQPIPIGSTITGICSPSACSIACFQQYPNQCAANFTGQTIGTCIGPVTTTTTMSTTLQPIWLGNLCVCTFCQSALSCYSPLYLGATSSAQCSVSACTQACQSRYSTNCVTTSYQGQVTGVCPTLAIGNVKCRCNCCGSVTGCIDYELNINGTCTGCQGACQQVSPCANAFGVTATCSYNHVVPVMMARSKPSVFLSIVILLLSTLS